MCDINYINFQGDSYYFNSHKMSKKFYICIVKKYILYKKKNKLNNYNNKYKY